MKNEPSFPASLVASTAGPFVATGAAGDSSLPRYLDMLDLAQSQLDQSEKLFFSGHDDEALRCIRTAYILLASAL